MSPYRWEGGEAVNAAESFEPRKPAMEGPSRRGDSATGVDSPWVAMDGRARSYVNQKIGRDISLIAEREGRLSAQLTPLSIGRLRYKARRGWGTPHRAWLLFESQWRGARQIRRKSRDRPRRPPYRCGRGKGANAADSIRPRRLAKQGQPSQGGRATSAVSF